MYDHLASVFISLLGIEYIINHIVALTKFTEQTLNDSHQANSLLSSEVSIRRKVILQNHIVLDILTASQGGTCDIMHTECWVFIPDVSSDVTHLMIHMKNQISALNDPLPSLGEY